jgi:hypothetical protein
VDARLNLYENTIGAKLSNESFGAPACVTSLGGYAVDRAPSLAAAVDPARGCPILGQGGAVEVGELVTNGEQFDQWLARHYGP